MATLESQLAALSGQALALQVQIQEIEAEINSLISQIQANPEQEGQLILAANALANQRVALREQLVAVNAKITALQEVQPPAPPLTAPVVGQTQTPVAPAVDQNTDPQPKTLNQTQGTDGETETPAPAGAPRAQTSVGAGANDDNPQAASDTAPTVDNSGSNSSDIVLPTVTVTASRLPGAIYPEPNILDQFATYTWQASLYLMTDDQYRQFITSKKKNLSGYNLLIQNSGAPVNKTGFVGNLQNQNFYENNGVTTSASAVGGRNPAFPLDFYIDNIVLKSNLLGGGTGLAHNTTELSFQITEPNGITLINRLYQAVQDAAPRNTTGAIDYGQAQYLMVIRWYGFDENGNPQPPPAQARRRNKGSGTIVEKTDPRAIVEKYIPFQIRDIRFTVSNRLVTYDVVTSPTGQVINATSRRGTIPADIELTGKTVGDVLQGNGAVSSTLTTPVGSQADVRRVDNALENNQAPLPASAAPLVGTLTAVGLAQAMNSLQQELVNKKIQEYADTYEIDFAPGAEEIQSAKITLKNPSANQGSTPMAAPASKSPDSKLSDKQSVAFNGRVIPISAGTSILYAIDQIIRNSSYIYDQANIVADEDNEYVQNSKSIPVKWFNVMMEAVPDGNKRDTLRNAKVYKIKYTITPYIVQNFVSRFFPSVTYLGVHKSYPYWFTGENTAVLDYSATINHMYQLVLSGSTPGNNAQNAILRAQSASMADQIKWYYAPRAEQSTAGAENRGNEIPAEAAEYLYGSTSMSTAKVRIIGDPAWIQQGSITGIPTIADSFNDPFLVDGTINFDGVQPMFEVSFQKPEDYNLETGLADPYRDKNDQERLPKQSFIYQGTFVTSEFRGGRFEQTIEGNIYPFPVPDGSNAVAKPPGKQDPRRLDNPNGAVIDNTGKPLKPQPGVNNTSGTIPAPEVAGATSPGGSYDGDDSGTTPADVATTQPPPEAPNSDGAEVAWYDYEPPPKLAGSGNNADPPQTMALET